MRKSIAKGLKNKKDELGQFNTSLDLATELSKSLSVSSNAVLVEPSFGSGNFLKAMVKEFKQNRIIGVEIDSEVYSKQKGVETYNKNFYDFKLPKLEKNSSLVFLGNPPYRTPAESLKTHKALISTMFKDFAIKGIKEEAVIFLLYTYKLIKDNTGKGEIHYILPKTIFFNPTPMFKSFYTFLRKNLQLTSMSDVSLEHFQGVSQDLVFASFKTFDSVNKKDFDFLYNGKKVSFDKTIGEDSSVISYKQIFKKTYLGSVPAESFLLSSKDESKESFKARMEKIFDDKTVVDESNLISLLSFNGTPHLQALKKGNEEKIKTVVSYINEIKGDSSIDKRIFLDEENYKPIIHRKENRFYFRHDSLKRVSFVYLINSNPTKSFFFTCNPNKISSDYFGYCDYDVNRNSSPGGIRTVPLEGMEDNLTSEFKKWWRENTTLDYSYVYEYLLFISRSQWYKDQKQKYNKMYFGVPTVFNKQFLKEIQGA